MIVNSIAVLNYLFFLFLGVEVGIGVRILIVYIAVPIVVISWYYGLRWYLSWHFDASGLFVRF